MLVLPFSAVTTIFIIFSPKFKLNLFDKSVVNVAFSSSKIADILILSVSLETFILYSKFSLLNPSILVPSILISFK